MPLVAKQGQPPVGRASRPPSDGRGERGSASTLDHDARPRRPPPGLWRSRRGWARHSALLARGCAPYYEHKSNDLRNEHTGNDLGDEERGNDTTGTVRVDGVVEHARYRGH